MDTLALEYRRPATGLLHHADGGSQYAGRAFQTLLAAHGLTCRMSRKGNCWDNAVAASFIATLKHELLAEADFGSHEAARRAIFPFIEGWYNRARLHSSLGYVSPVEYEVNLAAREKVACTWCPSNRVKSRPSCPPGALRPRRIARRTPCVRDDARREGVQSQHRP